MGTIEVVQYKGARCEIPGNKITFYGIFEIPYILIKENFIKFN